MPTPLAVLAGRVVDGQLDVVPLALNRAVQGWPDGVVTITIQPETRGRSVAQNKFYWGVCVTAVSEHTGYSPEEVHEIAKELFLPRHPAGADDREEPRRTTTTLSSTEMTEFIDQFRRWAAETVGVVIDDPKEAI
jgi:hypothetical protein